MSNLPACRRSYWRLQVVLCIVVLGSFFLAACGNGNSGAGLSRDEVEQIVRTEMAQLNPPPPDESGISDKVAEDAVREAIAAMSRTEMGLSRKEVEEIVGDEIARIAEFQTELIAAEVEGAIRKAIADISQSETGLNRNEVEQIVQTAIDSIPEPQVGVSTSEAESIARAVVASIPPKSAPAVYTKFFVSNAVSRYETQGLDATLAHYNREESVDGQWYVFIIDENDHVIGHPDPSRLGLDLKGWVGTDINGFNFGKEMLSATADGKWVSYVYRNPEHGGFGDEHSNALDYKHVWVVRHKGLLFASGWHISADEYTKFAVKEAIARYDVQGLEATLSYYNNPDNVNAQWYVFIATPEGEILGHYNAEGFAEHLQEILDDGSFEATEEGNWVNHEDVNPQTGKVEDKHFWLVEHDGLVFGSG